MKTNCWLVLGTMLATAAVAQVNTNRLPEIPPPATVAPVAPAVVESTNAVAPVKKAAVKHKQKKVVKKISEPAVALVSGPATVASDNLNVRGQAGLKGEVVGHLKKDAAVTVISQINLDKHAADEPAQWAKILLPADLKVWINSKFVDATNKVVSVKKLNLRAGPGENYSVLGVLEKGAPVSEVSAQGDWTQIEAPTNAFAFVAAMYLKQEVVPPVEPAAPAAVETPVVAAPPTTTNTVAETPAIVTQPATAPASAETNVPPVDTGIAAAPVVSAPVTPAPTVPTADTNPAPAVVDTNLPPPPPRVVTHEGYVRSSVSLVAPTYYELYDADSGNAINYLYTTTTNLNLARYKGFQIMVTGEEGLTARWQDTPVLTIQKIYVISTNPPATFQRVATPRASQRH